MDIIAKYIADYAAVIFGPVDPVVVDDVLRRHGVQEVLYREWLIRTGSGPIGPDWYFAVSELDSAQSEFGREPWKVGGFIIGSDGAGNPISLQRDGRILVEDHNFGGIYAVAASFMALLTKHTAT